MGRKMLMSGRHRSVPASAGAARSDSLTAAAAAAAVAAWCRRLVQQSTAGASQTSYSKDMHFRTTTSSRQSRSLLLLFTHIT